VQNIKNRAKPTFIDNAKKAYVKTEME